MGTHNATMGHGHSSSSSSSDSMGKAMHATNGKGGCVTFYSKFQPIEQSWLAPGSTIGGGSCFQAHYLHCPVVNGQNEQIEIGPNGWMYDYSDNNASGIFNASNGPNGLSSF